jgi:hypothetical protein
MNDMTKADQAILDAQYEQWETTFACRPEMFGVEPSYPARKSAQLFEKERKRKVLELGCGQGRDTLFFAASGLPGGLNIYSVRNNFARPDGSCQLGEAFC